MQLIAIEPEESIFKDISKEMKEELENTTLVGRGFKNNTEIKKYVNEIFQKNGHNPVTVMAEEFANGILFQKLFNILVNNKIINFV